MVTGPLRTVLWTLGGLAILWLIFALAMLPSMARMMGGGMMQGGGMHGGTGGWMMQDGMACCGGGTLGMMVLMALQGIVMLGLVGVFAYLVIDSVRRRRSAPRL